MAGVLNSVSAVAMIVIMVAAGFVMARAGWVKACHKELLIKLINSVAIPCMCVTHLLGDLDRAMLTHAGTLFLVAAIGIMVTVFMGIALAKLLKIERSRFAGFAIMCGLANTMFIGYPMCLQLFGESAVPYIMTYYIMNTFTFWTVGVFLLRRSGSNGNERFSFKQSAKGLLTPPLITLLVCAALLALDFKAPVFILTLTKYMGNLVTPLALIYVGYVLYETGLKNLKPDRNMWIMLAVRFIVAPAIMLLLCKLFALSDVERGVFTVESAMPVMIQTVVMSSAVGADEKYAALGMCISTLACFAVIPVLMLFV